MKNKLYFLHITFLLSCSLHAHAQIITTIVGLDSQAFCGDNGPAINAGLDGPYSVALDGKGNYYITDGYNNRIRKVNAAGIITTIAGNGTGAYNGDNIPAISAEIYHPVGITFDQVGNLYFTDAWNERLRKIDTNGIITTVAGNGIYGYNGDNIPADSAELYEPWGVAVDTHGNLYISDAENHRIRKVNTAGIITTIAGTGVAGYTGDNGMADIAEINAPYGISLDDTGNIYFVDANENVIRKIDISGIITTFAGAGTGASIGDNGPADSARFAGGPGGLYIDGNNNVYIGDIGHNRIRKITATTNIITTIVGNGTAGFSGDNGPATAAEVDEPDGMAIDAAGNLYFADFYNNNIRYVSNTTAINNINNIENGVSIYPNPSTGLFTVNIASDVYEHVQIIITNVLAEKIKEATVFTNTPTTIQLYQPSGIYFLSAISQHTKTNKIINLIN